MLENLLMVDYCCIVVQKGIEQQHIHIQQIRLGITQHNLTSSPNQ
jgi:hypothetical protein